MNYFRFRRKTDGSPQWKEGRLPAAKSLETGGILLLPHLVLQRTLYFHSPSPVDRCVSPPEGFRHAALLTARHLR
jgi:hypothetical protein